MTGPYRLVSFDLDGTLVDTAAEIAEAACLALEEQGLPRRPVPEIVALIGHGTETLIRALLARAVAEDPARAGQVAEAALLASMDKHYARTTGTTARPYPGAREAVDRLGAHGVFLACVTNKESRHAQRVLEATGLDDCFALVIGGDTLPYKKPDARVLQRVMELASATPVTTAHVGDSGIDVQAARNAGVAAWVVPYGYNGGRPITEAGPDRVFPGLAAVADHVLGTGT